MGHSQSLHARPASTGILFVSICSPMVLLALVPAMQLAAPKQEGASAVQIHVARDGDNKNAGTEQQPLASIEAALDKLVQLHKAGAQRDVTVVLHEGTYRIEKPLVVGPQHLPKGKHRLTFTAAKGERPTISGGRTISGWKKNGDGAFSTQVAEVASGKWTFRELFVNGKRWSRARHPNDGYLRIVKAFGDKRTGFYFKSGHIPKDLGKGAELVFLHDWSISRVPVKSVDRQQQRLTVAHNIGCSADHYKIDHFEAHPRYYIENDAALLDQPGEWYLNEKTGVLTYRPLAGETVKDIKVVAPLIGELVVVRGNEDQPVRNVHFQGLRFAHAAWKLPSGGYASGQATVHEWRDFSDHHSSRKMMESAITFENAEDCSITNCRIEHLGRSGVAFGSQTHRCLLEGNIFQDISGNSVNLGEDTSRRVKGQAWWQAAPKQTASHHTVANNLIQDGGRQFFGSVAVWVGIAHHMHIHHNEIRRHPYTGISLGWMWNPTPTPAGYHIVEKNHIHHVMQVLSDGGGIYTLGRQPGTFLRGNHIHDIPLNLGRAESNGMFLDQGSDQFSIVGNVIYKVDRSPLRFHQAKVLHVTDNILVPPDGKTPAYRYNNTDPATIKRMDNTVVEMSKFNMKSARPIIDAAGVQADYRRRLNLK